MGRAFSSCLVLLLAFSGCSRNAVVNSPPPSDGKPDLVILGITYSVQPACHEGYPSGIICIGPNALFTVKVGNIGTASLDRPFYISNSRSSEDFVTSYCSSTRMVNAPYDSVAIHPNGSIEVSFPDVFPDTVSKILFVINTDDRYDRGVPLPVIPESNYTNNSFVLNMKWNY